MGKIWTIERSYNEFEALHKKLEEKHLSVPPLPTHLLAAMTSTAQKVRKEDLNLFLRVTYVHARKSCEV